MSIYFDNVEESRLERATTTFLSAHEKSFSFETCPKEIAVQKSAANMISEGLNIIAAYVQVLLQVGYFITVSPVLQPGFVLLMKLRTLAELFPSAETAAGSE